MFTSDFTQRNARLGSTSQEPAEIQSDTGRGRADRDSSMPPTGAWRSLNSARRLRGPHLRLPIGKATLAGFLTGKAEMRGMCGAQHLMIEDIVNILIPYRNYGFCQRAADPFKPVRPPRPSP